VYALALLPEVHTGTEDEPDFIPALSVYVAFTLRVGSSARSKRMRCSSW
jgi:hypothetical protein